MENTSNIEPAERPNLERRNAPADAANRVPDAGSAGSANRRLIEVSPDLAAAIAEATRLGGAELLVETTRGRAAIYATRGAIAWVVGTRPGRKLSTLLVERTSISREVMRDAYRRCVSSGANFAETLIGEGRASRDDVRAALLDHNAEQLDGLLEDEIVRVEVVPRTREYASDLVYSLDEIDRARPTRHPPAPADRSMSERAAKNEESYDMADIKKSLEEVMKIDGSIACALVDWESGLTLGTAGGGGFDIELAASGNTDVVKAKVAVMRALGIPGGIEDILITLPTQYHLIRPLVNAKSLFLYLAIDRQKGNLGMARHRLRAIEEALEF